MFAQSKSRIKQKKISASFELTGQPLSGKFLLKGDMQRFFTKLMKK